MKRAWIAGCILVLLLAATLWNGLYLDQFTEGLTASLAQAQGMVEKGNWEGAARVTENTARRFQDRALYLHITLRHSEIDAVETSFREVEQLLAHRELPGEYAAANARLTAQLELIAESERLSLHNVL